MAVSFGNVVDTDYKTANSSGNTTSLACSVPAMTAKEGILVVAYTNQASGTISCSTSGYTAIHTTLNATYGTFGVFQKESDGTETSVTVATSVSANISIFVFRLPGAHSVRFVSTAEIATAADGATITMGGLGTPPWHAGCLHFTVLGALSTTGYTSGDEPDTQTYIGGITNASTWLGAAFEARTADSSITLGTWARTAGAKRMIQIGIQPYVPWVGSKSHNVTSTTSLTSASTHYLHITDHLTFVAEADQEVYELGVAVGSSVGDGSGLELGLYDVTSGYAGATLCRAATIGTLVNGNNVASVTPYALTAGNKYAMGVRCISATTVGIPSSNASACLRVGASTGSSALANWSDGGSTANSRLSLWANVRTSSAPRARILDAMTHNSGGVPASITVSAGSNRMLFVASIRNDSADATPDTTATLGGQSMTLLDTADTSGHNTNIALFYLNEAGIAAMSGNTLSVTGGSGSVGRSTVWWSVQDASQSTPAKAVSAANVTASTINGLALSRPARSLSFAVASAAHASGDMDGMTYPDYVAKFTQSSQHVAYGMSHETRENTAAYSWQTNVNADTAAVVVNVGSYAGAGALSITSVTPSQIDSGESVVIAGTGFGATQGSSFVKIGDTTQTVTAWSDTSITITADRASQSMGAATLTVVKV